MLVRILSLVTLLVGVSFASAQYKASDLVGKWVIKKSEDAPQGTSFTFKDDGTVILMIGKNETKGKYTLEGNQLTITVKFDGRERVDVRTIKTLSPRTLITENSKKKQEEMHKE